MPDSKARIAVFELNGTLYQKSSKEEFFKFLSIKKPNKLLSIAQLLYFKLAKKVYTISHSEFNENFFHYLDSLPPKKVEELAKEFWKIEYPRSFNKEVMERLEALKMQGIKIYCVTASVELYLKPLFDKYKIDGFMGTKIKYNGSGYEFVGELCKGKEKLIRLDQHFQDRPYEIVEAYSDSEEEILDEAGKAFLIKEGKFIPYK